MGALAVDEISIMLIWINMYIQKCSFFEVHVADKKRIVARGCKSQIVYLKSLQLL